MAIRLRLRTKFIILFSIVALVPLLAVSLLTFFRFRSTLQQDAANLGRQLTATAATEIKSFVISQVSILDTIATIYHPEFPLRPEGSGKIVENILYRSENFTDISIVDKTGREIERQNRILVITPSELRNLGNTPAFQIVKEKGIYIGPMFIQSGKPFFEIGRWIVDSQGTFSGAVFAQVDAKVMPILISRISAIAGPGGRLYVVDDKGIVLAHPDLSYILAEKNLSFLPPVSNILAQKGEIDSSQTYTNETGEHVLGSAYQPVIDPLDLGLPEALKINWFVIAEQPVSAVFAEVSRVGLFSALLSLLAVAAAIAAAIFFARRISKPVETLHAATTEFAKGNFKYRSGVSADDEIGDLARSFDTMARNLGESINIVAAERNKLSVILSGITNAVVAVDLSRNIILFNKAAEALTGLSSRKVIGTPVSRILKIFDNREELPAEKYCPVQQSDFEGVVFAKNNLRMADTEGREHYVNLIAGTIREGISVGLGCILTFQDITREFAVEKMKAEFVSIAAHQLRTPTTGIKWSLDLLASERPGKLSPPQKKIVDAAFEASNRMAELINDLLDVGRVEEGHLPIELKRQSLSPLLERVISNFKSEAEKKGVTLKLESPSMLPPVDMDAEKMEIVLNNLISNAIKYTQAKGTVTVAVSLKENELILEVKDTGIGIPKAEFDRVFTKFFRSKNAQLSHTSGSGLGLYVAKKVIDQHHGSLNFQSEENKGSTFTMAVPIPR